MAGHTSDVPDASSPLPPTSVPRMRYVRGSQHSTTRPALTTKISYTSHDIHRSSRRIWTVAFVCYQLRASLPAGCAPPKELVIPWIASCLILKPDSGRPKLAKSNREVQQQQEAVVVETSISLAFLHRYDEKVVVRP